MSVAVSVAESTCLFQLPLTLALESGDVLEGGQLAYERFGNPRGPLVLVQGGISAGRHVATRDGIPGWWDGLVRVGGAIDLERYCVIGIDYLGGVGASSSPANHDQQPFPVLAPIDQARATLHLLDHLEVERVHAFVGASYGGMVGLALAAEQPARLERLIAISAPARSHPRSTAWRIIQRRIVQLGLASDAPADALRLARALAMTTYRSASEFGTRFVCEDAAPEQRDVWRYLEARGDAFAESFDPACFLTLSEAIDRHVVEPQEVRVPTLVVAVDTDELVPPSQLAFLAEQLEAPARLARVTSPFGHDAFLKEIPTMDRLVRDALASTEVSR